MGEYVLKLDYYGLVNLHKALLEAKFHSGPENGLVAGSPLVAEIYVQVRDLLMESERGEEWREWFRLENRPDRRDQAIAAMKKHRGWKRAGREDRARIARNYLAPFLFTEEELEAVVAAVGEV